jgi:hypothetical protein
MSPKSAKNKNNKKPATTKALYQQKIAALEELKKSNLQKAFRG